jgi:tetratricopeptide (TPR) repeat protein
LQVASRTSAFQFKRKGYDISEIGRKLNVQLVMEGSIRKAGNKLRITAQLVNVSDGYHLWSEKYDRDMEDIFAIQDEISLAIVDKLKIKLLGVEKTKLVKRYTENKEAYNLYLKGRYFWNRRTEVGIGKAIAFFKSAIEIDPLYALPYIGIADTYNVSGHYCFIPPGEAFEKARAAVIKALKIDKNLSEAHASLGWIHTFYDRDWILAEKEYKLSIELNPEYATAHEWFAILLAGRGRFDEAMTEIKIALELDPLSAMINAVFGGIFLFSRRYEEAIEQFRKTLEISPNFPFAYLWQGGAYMGIGDYDKALASVLKSATLVKDMTYSMGLLGMAYAFADQDTKALKVLARMEKLSKIRYVSPLHKAYIYMGLNNKDKAFEYMDAACDERDPWLFYIKILPMFDSLRSDPRYLELLKKLGLEK